jgi:cytochrome oxidase Cu insertion factor (SCO1/SenC/PrrC family)
LLHSSLAKLVGSRVFWALFVFVLFALPLGRSLARTLPPPPPILGEVAPYSLHDQDGEVMGSAELHGHVYVVRFVATDASPATIEELRTLVHRTKNLGTFFRMVTIAKDAALDTQARRHEMLLKYCSSSLLWSYVGGTDAELGAASRAITGAVGAGPADAFYLVDVRGRLRGVYGNDKPSIDRLMQDISYVANIP